MAFPFSEIGKSVREAGMGWKSGVWFRFRLETSVRHPSKAVKDEADGFEFRGEV